MTTFLQKGLTAAVDRVKIIFESERCGSSSVVECHLAKVDVASSNLVYRSTDCGCSSMAELQPSKLATWVRFPSPAPKAPLTQLDRVTAF